MRMSIKMGIKILAVLSLLVCFFACGQRSETVSLEKDGQLYEIADSASFYYPKEFTVDTALNDKQRIQFVYEEEVIFYSMIIDDTDNQVEDMPALYVGQLEEDGAENVGYTTVTIESGLTCQEFTGSYQATGIKFKHMVYFTADAVYIMGYQAPQAIYDEDVTIMTQYLNTLTANHK